jgi:hypothetical protein
MDLMRRSNPSEVGQVASTDLLVVTLPDFPASNVAALVAVAKGEPGKTILARQRWVTLLFSFKDQIPAK